MDRSDSVARRADLVDEQEGSGYAGLLFVGASYFALVFAVVLLVLVIAGAGQP